MLRVVLDWLTGRVGSGIAKGVSSAGAVAAILGAVAWLFGPGREWHACLNSLELAGAVAVVSVLVWWALRLPPPGA